MVAPSRFQSPHRQELVAAALRHLVKPAITFSTPMRYNSFTFVHHAWKEIVAVSRGGDCTMGPWSLPVLGGQAMPFVVDAVYEKGILKLDQPLPLQENERVQVTVQPKGSVTELTYGLIGWTGDPEVLRKIAEDDEFGVMESP